MTNVIAQHISRVELGKLHRHENMIVIPVLTPELDVECPGARFVADCLTLDAALAAGTLTVTEVSEGGSVSHLLVVNEGELPVLIVDGEELVGAKQNRVLNTSVLLGAHGKYTVDVSCVERGRWAYRSRTFSSCIPRRAPTTFRNRSSAV